MGSMGLPNPFQAPVPQGSPTQGPMVGPNPSLAMKQQPGAQIAQAMTQLMTGFVEGKKAREAHFDQKYQSAVQEIINGTNPNPDYHEIMKWAKLSGRPINMNVNPAEAQASLQTPAIAAHMASSSNADFSQGLLANGMPAQSPAGGSAADPTQGMPPQGQGQAPAPQGVFSRLAQKLGLSAGPIPEGTQMEQMLRGLQGVGQSSGGAVGMASLGKQNSLLDQQVHATAAKFGIAHDEALLPLYQTVAHKAIAGDPEAMQMLEQFGIGKGNPLTDYKVLQHLIDPTADPSTIGQRAADLGLQLQMGMPQFRMKMYELAAAPDRLAMFGNDFAKSFANLQDPTNGPQAGYTPLQQSQLAEADAKAATKTEAYATAHSKYYAELMDQFPDAPPNLVEKYASAKAAGQDDTAQAISKFIGGDVTSKQPPRYSTKNQWEQKRFDQRLGFDYTNYAGNLAVRQGELDNRKLDTVIGALREQPATREAMHVIEHQGDYSGDQVRDAYETIQQSSQNLKDLTVEYNGKKLPVTNPQELVKNYNWAGTGWAYGRPSLSPQTAPNLSQFYSGGPQQATQGSHPPVTASQEQIRQALQRLTPEEQEALSIPDWLKTYKAAGQ